VPNSSEVLASPRMAALVRELKNRYANRLILFDLPPLLSTDDAIAFAPYVDAALVVVREGATTREALDRALRSLGQTLLLGTVLNGTAERFHSYYSYY